MQIVKKALLANIGIIIYIFSINIMFLLGRNFSNIEPSLVRIGIAILIGIILILLKLMPIEQLKGIGNKSFKVYAYPIIFSCLYLITFIAVYAVTFGTQHFQLNTNIIFSTLMLLIAISLFEEIVARAFFVNYFNKIFVNMEKFIVISSGVVFGVVHYLNYGVLNIDSISQCISATCIGVFLCAVFIRENRIFPVIIIHTVINLSAAMVSLIYNTDIISQNYESIWFLPIIVSVFSIPFLPLGLKLLNEQSS
ncbi:MAG: CPBP family intramembrane metalloprotease [Oscillospiraceae bacterium]|jgi:membrane protease YdiL (CAAX protease family)|nr:CPBP family intramembrane metalloprotease [Oscillospiraceae bacterium]